MNDRRPPDDRDDRTLALLEQAGREVRDAALAGEIPRLELPVRALDNVTYDPDTGYLRLGGRTKLRSLGLSSIRSFAQTLRMMAVSKDLITHDDFATKREAYYISKNWGECRFHHQAESDAVMDDIEALVSREGLFREQLRYVPEEHGGAVVGALTVVDRDPESGARVEIDCRRFGRGAWSVPWSVEHLEFASDARYILAIETGGMFQRLNHYRLWQRDQCILVEMGGVPTRATRRFVRRLVDACRLPLYCFVDCDPYGFTNIYRTLKAGSANAAHINAAFCVPSARLLGVTPQDIVDFGLEDATHPLSATDVKRARDALAHDPFFSAHPAWAAALRQQLAMGVRAEQQALAKWGLRFVMDEYLPRKLADPGRFLP